MTDQPMQGPARDRGLCLGLAFAAAALGLRLWLIGFFPFSHCDEPIIGSLMERAVESGTMTASWEGFPEAWWSRSTYQFSPYTLLLSALARLGHAMTGMPFDMPSQIVLARVSSCCFGGAAVFLVFLVGRLCFGTAAGLLAEALFAVCLTHVQDSMYARVDSLVGLLVLLTVWLSLRAARRPTPGADFVLAAVFAGVTVAAKYNAVVILLFLTWVPACWWWTGRVSPARSVLLLTASLGLAVLGFCLATPEVITRPGPLLDGMAYEARHYAEGHLPHQAHDWADNNVIYWARYLCWLGIGFPGFAAALLFFLRAGRLRRGEEVLLGTYCAAALMLLLLSKVRFERNLETFLGPLTIISGAAAWDVARQAGQRLSVAQGYLGLVLLVSVWLGQPVCLLSHFRETISHELQLQAQLRAFEKEERTLQVSCAATHPTAENLRYPQIALLDWGDPFSAEILREWQHFLGTRPYLELRSPWSKHGYPFSTVDTIHGPRRALLYRTAHTRSGESLEPNE